MRFAPLIFLLVRPAFAVVVLRFSMVPGLG